MLFTEAAKRRGKLPPLATDTEQRRHQGDFSGFGGGAGKGPGIGRSHDNQTPRICGCTKLAYDRMR